MPKRATPQPEAATPAPPHVIEPNGVYFSDTFRAWFRLKRSTLRAEVKAGRLRVARRAGQYFILGKWILAWIEGDGRAGRQPRLHNGSSNGEETPRAAGESP